MSPYEALSSEQDVIDFCACALSLARPSSSQAPAPSSVPAAVPAWYSFETAAWSLGEDVRHAFRRNPSLRRNQPVVLKVLEVAACRPLRKGRQSFVLALGFAGALKHAPVLAAQLDDPDVSGEVVEALLKMKAGGFASRVRPLLDARQPRLRRLAQRYVGRYQDETA